jgi:outer membrane lipoprotein carrier protein
MSQRVKLLSLTVTSSGAIESIQIEEIDGAVTEFTFSAMQENLSVRDSDFRFNPPAGVAVVDGIAPI